MPDSEDHSKIVWDAREYFTLCRQYNRLQSDKDRANFKAVFELSIEVTERECIRRRYLQLASAA